MSYKFLQLILALAVFPSGQAMASYDICAQDEFKFVCVEEEYEHFGLKRTRLVPQKGLASANCLLCFTEKSKEEAEIKAREKLVNYIKTHKNPTMEMKTYLSSSDLRSEIDRTRTEIGMRSLKMRELDKKLLRLNAVYDDFEKRNPPPLTEAEYSEHATLQGEVVFYEKFGVGKLLSPKKRKRFQELDSKINAREEFFTRESVKYTDEIKRNEKEIDELHNERMKFEKQWRNLEGRSLKEVSKMQDKVKSKLIEKYGSKISTDGKNIDEEKLRSMLADDPRGFESMMAEGRQIGEIERSLSELEKELSNNDILSKYLTLSLNDLKMKHESEQFKHKARELIAEKLNKTVIGDHVNSQIANAFGKFCADPESLVKCSAERAKEVPALILKGLEVPLRSCEEK